MRFSASPVDLLEAAYRLDGSDAEWLQALVEAGTKIFAHEGLGGGGACLVGRIDPETGARGIDHYLCSAGVGTCNAVEKTLELQLTLPVALQQQLFFSRDVGLTASEAIGVGEALHTLPFWKAIWDPCVHDALGFVGQDGVLGAVNIGIGLRETQTVNGAARTLLKRVAMHIGTAYRVRSATRGKRSAATDNADAIFTHAGRCVHTRAPSRERSLAAGIQRRARARTMRDQPESALDVWRGLVDGKWSLVDYVDTDGKALVLAVRNDPARDISSSLTDGQRAVVALASLGHGNKQIAYALGMSVGAVTMHLARARAATKLKSRAALIRAFKQSLASSAA